MSARHTPGPWSVVYYDCGDRDYYDHNGPCPSVTAENSDCAIVHWDGFKQRHWASANGNQKQIEANAHLIAAAPDLLEALTRLRGIAIHHLHQSALDAATELLASVDAAIAKAKGNT